MKKVFVLIMAMLSSQMTLAADLNCTGKIQKIRVGSGASVFITTDWHTPANVTACSLTTTWKNITPDVCKQWLASLQSAMYLNKNVSVYYTASSSVTCSAMPSGGNAEGASYIEYLN